MRDLARHLLVFALETNFSLYTILHAIIVEVVEIFLHYVWANENWAGLPGQHGGTLRSTATSPTLYLMIYDFKREFTKIK